MPSSSPGVADDLALRAVIVKLIANVLRDVACQVVLCGLRIHLQHAQLSGFNVCDGADTNAALQVNYCSQYSPAR